MDGPYFTVGQPGQPRRLHRWIGLTAFTLLKRLLTGEDVAALAFLDWAATLGVNTLRVFSQVDWTGPPGKGVEPGFYAGDYPGYDQAVQRLFALAAARGLYVELVAHTFSNDLTGMASHLQRCDHLVTAASNAVLEVANEPSVNRIDLAGLLARYTPGCLWASGQYDPTPYPAGRWINDHPDRGPEFPRKPKGMIEYGDGSGPYTAFRPPFSGPVVADEPKRLDDADGSPDDWASFAACAALFGAGLTLHSLELERCIILTDPAILARIAGVFQGLVAIPVQRYTGYQHVDDQGSLRRYRRQGEDGRTYEVSIRPFGVTVS